MSDEDLCPVVLADIRESEDRIALVKRRRYYKTIVKELPVGDYVVTLDGEVGYAGIEYKSASDFNSDFGRELPRKLMELEASFKEAYLVVVGDLSEALLRNPRLRFNHIERGRVENRAYGALLSIIAHRKVGVILLEKESDFPEWLTRICRRAVNKVELGEGVEERPILTMKGTDRSLDMERDDALCALTGLGRGASRALLERFKTLRGIADASLKELKEVPGIGPARALHLHEVFHGKEDVTV